MKEERVVTKKMLSTHDGRKEVGEMQYGALLYRGTKKNTDRKKGH